MLKAIHARESREAADQNARTIVEHLRASKMSMATDLVGQAARETLTDYAFPDIHWQKFRTTNPLERIMKEIRCRTRVVGAVPDRQSCLNLAAAAARLTTSPLRLLDREAGQMTKLCFNLIGIAQIRRRFLKFAQLYTNKEPVP